MDFKKYFNIRWIGVALFVITCIFGFLLIESQEKVNYHKRLKLVSIFSRHGDRSPGDPLPIGDRHKDKFDFFWPNGFGELTDTGKYRLFHLGLENRRRYAKYVGYDSRKFLALSSPKPRCQESLREMLRGMFTMDTTKDHSRAIMDQLSRSKNCTKCIPDGSGTPNEWRQIPIDTNTVPSLIFEYLNHCKYRIDNPSPIDDELTASPEIKALPGIEELRKVLLDRFNQKLNFTSLDLWSTLASEMTIEHTTETINYTDHYSDWVNRPVTRTKKAKIPLFDLFEQACVIGYRDRLNGWASYIQSGTIVTSLVESQLVALGQLDPNNGQNKRAKVYEGKKMVLYSSHDTILQRLLFDLGVLRTEGSFEDRFNRYRNSDSLTKFLSGMKMCSFGLSFRVELFELEATTSKTNKKFHFVSMSMYNKEDAKFDDYEYRPVEFGTMCRRMFVEKYPNSKSELGSFYDSVIEIDLKFDCPFSLFRNITSHLMTDEKKMSELCPL